ncbi:MAG TPA: hypothetical protein VIP80_04280 [Gemmatimonadales bacterium]
MQEGVEFALRRLRWMRESGIWPNGLRYLWTDAFGLVLLLSLHRLSGEETWLEQAESLVAEVDRVLGRARGYRIGEAPDRDGQYFHYLAMWLFALWRLSEERPAYRQRALRLVREIHPAFVLPGQGVLWKMREDLSGPYPGYGFGALDAFHGAVVYRLLDPVGLAAEIAELEALVQASFPRLVITQDLGLGMMLWFTQFQPDRPWAEVQRARSLEVLDRMWIEPPGYFCREPGARSTKFAFTNYGVAVGLQAVGAWPERVSHLSKFFDSYRSGDRYDEDAITHVMACSARLPGLLLANPPG